ncbi:hypothetical protein ACIQOV_06400 [Kitasatospora sp. NPDC091257]|uniref:hypothetical protein n=1 Tax=Kitasatospora sp. NPDC091257 TaxID=3364084 RepID=UPI003822105E
MRSEVTHGRVLWHNADVINPRSLDLTRFLTDWYGPRDVPAATLPAAAAWLPAPLKAWFTLEMQWSIPLVISQKMIPCDAIEPRDGMAIFMTDSSGDWRWAFDVSTPNVVYESALHRAWEMASEELSDLLLHNAIGESVMNSRASRLCSHVPANLLPEILAPMDEVGFLEWRWPAPGCRTYMGDSLVAQVGPSISRTAPWGPIDQYFEVQVGTSKIDGVSYLDGLGIEWI